MAAGFAFEFREPDAAPNPMMVLDGVDCGYAEAEPPVTILHNLALSIQNGQRIGLLGANGQGKSTLVKTLAGTQDPLTGKLRLGKGLQIGYFAQHQLETLRDHDSPLQHLARLAPDTREQELRDFLGSFNFRGDMATAPIEPFSGGEKARLALALIVWQKPNLLLLDEPTNHLDLDTREALTMALAQFEGTLILVSHDRHLLRATADQFMLVADGTIKPFDATWTTIATGCCNRPRPSAMPPPPRTWQRTPAMPRRRSTARTSAARRPTSASGCQHCASR